MLIPDFNGNTIMVPFQYNRKYRFQTDALTQVEKHPSCLAEKVSFFFMWKVVLGISIQCTYAMYPELTSAEKSQSINKAPDFQDTQLKSSCGINKNMYAKVSESKPDMNWGQIKHGQSESRCMKNINGSTRSPQKGQLIL